MPRLTPCIPATPTHIPPMNRSYLLQPIRTYPYIQAPPDSQANTTGFVSPQHSFHTQPELIISSHIPAILGQKFSFSSAFLVKPIRKLLSSTVFLHFFFLLSPSFPLSIFSTDLLNLLPSSPAPGDTCARRLLFEKTKLFLPDWPNLTHFPRSLVRILVRSAETPGSNSQVLFVKAGRTTTSPFLLQGPQKHYLRS